MKADARFVEDFNKSHDAVSIVADFWRGVGLQVEIPKPILRPDSAVRHLYSDNGDLLIPEAGRNLIQVKGRSNVSFTGPEDYPYDSVFVDEYYKLKRCFDSLHSYCILSKDKKKLCVVYWHTGEKWLKVEKPDHNQGRVCIFVSCPVDECRWYDL